MRNVIPAFAALATTLLAGRAEAVKANPLPKPQTITWGSGGAKAVGSLRLVAPDSDVIKNGFDRATKAISALKWIPAATEAPVRSFQPFPTPAPAKRQTNSTGSISSVNVKVDDTHAALQHGVDESYTLEI